MPYNVLKLLVSRSRGWLRLVPGGHSHICIHISNIPKTVILKCRLAAIFMVDRLCMLIFGRREPNRTRGWQRSWKQLSYIFMENKWPDYLFIYLDIRCLEKSLSLSLELWMYAKKCQQFASTYDTNKTVVRPMDCRDSEIWPTSRLSLRELQYKTIYLYMYRKKKSTSTLRFMSV